MVKFIGDRCHADTLSGIAERLRAGYLHDIIIGITGYARLVRRLERTSEVLAKIHGKIGEIFYDDHVVFVGHLADDLQLLVGEAKPSRIVRVGIDHRSNIAFGKMRFQGLTQSLATIFVYVERLIFIAHNGYLLFLHGESGVDKQDGVFSRRTLSGRKERGVCALHGTGYGYATLWVYIYIYKRLDKAGSLLFHFGSSVDVRVDRRYTVTKGFDLSVYAYLSGFQARYAHFHMDELGSRFLFQLRGYGNYLPDSRFPKIGKSKAIDNPSGCLIVYRSIFHASVNYIWGQKYEIYRFVLIFSS